MELRKALLDALKLKEISRAGWINSGLKNVESVAAHSWGVSYLALILMPEGLDKEKILSMAIFHDGPNSGHGVRYITKDVERRAIQIYFENYSSDSGWSDTLNQERHKKENLREL